MDELIKNAEIKIRLSKELKDNYNAICKKNAINQSEWLRQQIEEFVKKNTK